MMHQSKFFNSELLYGGHKPWEVPHYPVEAHQPHRPPTPVYIRLFFL